jgi:hypothetical protein
MERFYSGGGNSNPDFVYKFKVKSVPDDMWNWCENYPLTGPFQRWYVDYYTGNFSRDTTIQFESRKAAYVFRIAFSEYILKDLTYDFAKDATW